MEVNGIYIVLLKGQRNNEEIHFLLCVFPNSAPPPLHS